MRNSIGGKVSKLRFALLALAGVAALPLVVGVARADVPDLLGKWQTRAPSGPERQEVSYVEAGGKFYLAGGFIPGQGGTNPTDAHEVFFFGEGTSCGGATASP